MASLQTIFTATNDSLSCLTNASSDREQETLKLIFRNQSTLECEFKRLTFVNLSSNYYKLSQN